MATEKEKGVVSKLYKNVLLCVVFLYQLKVRSVTSRSMDVWANMKRDNRAKTSVVSRRCDSVLCCI